MCSDTTGTSDVTQVDEITEIIQRITEKIKQQTPEEIENFERLQKIDSGRARWRAMANFGVPKRARERLANGFIPDTHAVKAVVDWQKNNDLWCLVLSGPPGVGKTMAAAFWLWLLTDGEKASNHHVPCWYTSAQLAVMSSYDGKIECLWKLNAMVIDDLGTEYIDQRGHLNARLDAMIDSRYAEERRTLITTNLTFTEFKARYGDRIADRMNEGGSFIQIKIKSYRQRSTQEGNDNG